ncbi:MAG: restriction endonuclease subunit S [Desulfobulbaceae bacterium]|nr:restriction endonuclease subunit S [Desulfobulbaceae bacterium]
MESVIKAIDNFNFLKLVSFKDFALWDVKRLVAERIASVFPIVSLGDYIKEENTKIRPALEPEKEHKILGVNNIDGIFDAYTQLGKEIKQPYKIMKEGFLAYNPYRINVGSIGLKTKEHNNDLISPAYVVFSCKSGLSPDFLYKLFKTDRFNKVIRDNTTGSVRQNLTIDILKTLEIPLPKPAEQEELLNEYYIKIQAANNLSFKANEIQESILPLIRSYLGIEFLLWEKKQGLHFTSLKDIKRWAVWNVNNYSLKKGFPKYTLEQLISISSGKFLPANKQEGDEYFVYGGNGINGTHSEYCFEGKRIIIGRVGEYCGNVHLVDGKYWVTDNAFWSERKKEIFTWEYLEVVLTGLDLNKFRVISAQPSISQSNILELEIPVPSFQEQNEIVEIVQEKRKQIEEIKNEVKSLKVSAIKDFEAKIFKR